MLFRSLNSSRSGFTEPSGRTFDLQGKDYETSGKIVDVSKPPIVELGKEGVAPERQVYLDNLIDRVKKQDILGRIAIEKLSPDEYQYLVSKGAVFDTDRMGNPQIGYSQRARQQDLREKVSGKVGVKKPEGTLISWLRSEGGIWDESLPGEMKEFGSKESGVVGLVKKGGKPFDILAKDAQNYGWDVSSPTGLMNLIRKETKAIKEGRIREPVAGKEVVPEERFVLRPEEKEGFVEVRVKEELRAGDLNKGDELLIEGERYEHKGFDSEGKAIITDDKTYKLEPWEEIDADAVKRTGIDQQARILEQIKKESPEEYAKILKGNTAELVKEWEAKRLGKTKQMTQEGMFEEPRAQKGLFGGERGAVEIPAEEIRRAGRRTMEFWKPFSTLPHKEKLLFERGKAMGDMARVDRIVEKMSNRLDKLSDVDLKDVFRGITNQVDLWTLPKENKHMVKYLANLNDVIGEMLVKRKIITVDQFNAHKGEYIKFLYSKHLLGDEAKIPFKKGGKLDLSEAKHRKDLTWEQRRTLGIIEDVSIAEPFGMAQALGDAVKYDRLLKISEDPRNIWMPSMVEITDWPKEYTQRGAKTQATLLSRSTGDKHSPVHISKDRWIVWNEDTGKAVGNKFSIGELVDEVEIYKDMHAKTPGVPEIQYRLQAYMKALEEAKVATKNVPEDFIEMPTSKHWGPLSGTFIRKEIARDLQSFYGKEKGNIQGLSKAVEFLGDLDLKMTGVFKVAKVPLNLPAVVRNTMANPILMWMKGIPLYEIPKWGIEAAKQWANKTPEYTKAFRAGLFKTNFSIVELNEVMMAFRSIDTGSFGQIIHGVQKIAGKYGRIDDFFKFAVYLEARAKGVPFEKAILDAQKWIMDYSLADPFVKSARRHMIPFASFTYKIIPLVAESAIKRPWVIGSLMALPKLMFEASKLLNPEIEDAEWRELRKFIPLEVKERGTWMLVPVKIGGKWRWFDYGYFLPWGNVWNAMQSIYKGGISGALGQLGVAASPLYNLVKTFAVGAIRDDPPKDPFFGSPIYNRLDSASVKMGKTTEYLINMFTPSMFALSFFEGENPRGALGYTLAIGKEDKWGRQIDLTQALARWGGVNLIEANPKLANVIVKAKINALKDELIKIQGDPNISGETKEKYRQRFLEEINELLTARGK